ncbi:MAG: hypothetical protein ABIO06_01635 [Pseudolysinimonas sp.]
MRNLLLDVVDLQGGIVSRRQLRAWGVDHDAINVAAWYGRHLIRVRNGWFARPSENREVLRAWRVGGRLTCASALAFHDGVAPGPVLHIEVPGWATQLRDPDNHRKRLGPEAAVVIHWARHPGPGTARAVTAEYAERVAAACGVRSGAVTRSARRPSQAAASSESASRIV